MIQTALNIRSATGLGYYSFFAPGENAHRSSTPAFGSARLAGGLF
jgi:hypothetical protein